MIPYRSKSMYLNKQTKVFVKVEEIVYFLTMTMGEDTVDVPEIHDFWELVYLESGEAVAVADGVETKLFPSDIIIHKPGEAHSIKATNNTSIKVFFISFYSTSKLLKIFNSQKISLTDDEKKMIYKIYDEARDLFVNKAPDIDKNGFSSLKFKEDYPIGAEQAIRNYIELLLIMLARGLEKKNEIVTCRTKEELEKIFYQKILETISRCVKSRLSAEIIASEFNYSRTYIYTVFKKYAGMTLMQYCNFLKIKEAKRLMSYPDKTICEISIELGFKNQYYFSKVFKRFENQSPSEYRRSLR